MRDFRGYVLLLLIGWLPAVVLAQVHRGSADAAIVTDYSINGVPDSIFVFSPDNPNRFINIRTPDGDSAMISRYRFDNGTETYSYEDQTRDISLQLGVNSDADFNEPFGYQFVIEGDGYSDTSRCWLVINSLRVVIYNADTSDIGGSPQKVIRTFQKRCNLVLDINARIDTAAMPYFDLDAGQPAYVYTNLGEINNRNWNSSPSAPLLYNGFSPNDNTWLSVVVNDPWWEDVYFVISVSDVTMNYTVSDSVFYESIVPHADFTSTDIPLDSATYYPDRPERYYEIYNSGAPGFYDFVSGPAIYHFKQEAENANMYTWYFGDGTTEVSTLDTIVHTYLLPGDYFPYLLAENHLITGEVCADTFPEYDVREESKLAVEKPQVAGSVPNVFSPPNPPNNYWRFYDDVSITNFEISIYNRIGQRVYHFKGNIREWEGWDGSIRDSGRIASTGVYYYVIKEITALPYYVAPGDDPIPTEDIFKDHTGDNTLRRGFIHLYNDE